jgi:hypothetical protein
MAKHPQRLEAGAFTVGIWLLAAAIAPAAQTTDYLPVIGAAPLLFQPPVAVGKPAGWPPLPQPDEPGTNVTRTALATNALALAAPAATNLSVSPPLVMAAASPPPPPPVTTAEPAPPPPPDLSQPPLPPPTESPGAANPGIDMASLLRWLSPAFANPPPGGFLFPAFVPATPPLSSTAVYESH